VGRLGPWEKKEKKENWAGLKRRGKKKEGEGVGWAEKRDFLLFFKK